MKGLTALIMAIMIILIAGTFATGCKQQPTSTTDTTPAPATPSPAEPETRAYRNSEYGFSLEYPKDWDAEEDLMGAVVVIYGPSVLDGNYLVNVNLVTEPLPEFPEVTLEEYCRMGEIHIKRAVENYEKVEEGSTTISGQTAMNWVISFTIEIAGEDLPLKNCQTFCIKDNIAYIFTYDVPAEFYDKYYDCYEVILNSLRFD